MTTIPYRYKEGTGLQVRVEVLLEPPSLGGTARREWRWVTVPTVGAEAPDVEKNP